jgi:hypothetical protein
MMTFRESLKQRRRKTTTSTGAEHQILEPDNQVGFHDTCFRLRWRTRERVRLVHGLEAK